MNSDSPADKSSWISDAFRRYESQLVRYAARLLGDVDRARDVTQDTFVKLCRQDSVELDGKLAAWLFTVCRNRALDVQKKERRMKTMADQTVDHCASHEPSPDAPSESTDSVDQIHQAIGELSSHQQEVLRLKIQNGLSYREISEITGLSTSNVGYLLHTGIKRIREQLAE